MEFLKGVGIGGAALGVTLLLLRDYLQRLLELKFRKRDAYKLMLLFLVLVWSIAAIGVAGYVWIEQTKLGASARNTPASPDKPAVSPRAEIPAQSTSPQKPLTRVVCKAEESNLCPLPFDNAVGCFDPWSAVQDFVKDCKEVLHPQIFTGPGASCGVNMWKFTCIPK